MFFGNFSFVLWMIRLRDFVCSVRLCMFVRPVPRMRSHVLAEMRTATKSTESEMVQKWLMFETNDNIFRSVNRHRTLIT